MQKQSRKRGCFFALYPIQRTGCRKNDPGSGPGGLVLIWDWYTLKFIVLGNYIFPNWLN